MINFEARCTSLKYGKPYDHGVKLLLLIMYFCIETKINVFCSSVNSFVPKRSKYPVYVYVARNMLISLCKSTTNVKSWLLYWLTINLVHTSKIYKFQVL
jgi:hypothetical protein